MNRPPAELAAEVAAAILAEREALHALRLARARVVEALRALRQAGVPTTTAAIARAMHLPATTAMRRCLAHRLRQRLHRVTQRDANLLDRSSPPPTPTLLSEKKEEPTMAQIIRKTTKTTTTDYLAEDGEEIDDVEPDADEEDGEEAAEETESKRSRRATKRR